MTEARLSRPAMVAARGSAARVACAGLAGALLWAPAARAQAQGQAKAQASVVRLADVMMRDASVLPDPASHRYYIVASGRGASVRAYTSTDLVNWEGPHTIFQTPPAFWGEGVNIRGIWAPELHAYRGKYYLFLTFDSSAPLPEQWAGWFNWLPRVRRGSQVLVSDSPLGPFRPFSSEPTLPRDRMTLDGTLWVEDGVPYMVYSHEWVQIVDGAIAMVRLKDDLSAVAGEAKVLFRGSDGPWAQRSKDHGCWVTDGPYLLRSKSGKLFMLWSSFGAGGYMVGLAISPSGKLAGPWVQQAEPIYAQDGGHPMLFRTFDGKLLMSLHSPNSGPNQRIHFFEMEDTGETLRIVGPFKPE